MGKHNAGGKQGKGNQEKIRKNVWIMHCEEEECSWANMMGEAGNGHQMRRENKMGNASEKQLGKKEDLKETIAKMQEEERSGEDMMSNKEMNWEANMEGNVWNKQSWGDMVSNILNKQKSWGEMMEDLADKQVVEKGVWMQVVVGMVRVVAASGMLAVITIGAFFGIFICGAIATLFSPILIPFLALFLLAFTVALTLLGILIAASSAYSSLPSLIHHHHRGF